MIQESILISKFEKYKGHSSNLFDNEEWRECDAFIAGYNIAKTENKTALEILEENDVDYRDFGSDIS